MNIKKTGIWSGIIVAVIAVFVFIGINDNKSSPQAASKASQGSMAPDFDLPSSDGKRVTLSSFRGKQNVLIYFHGGLSCGACMQQMPELDKYLSDFKKMDVKLLYVALDSPEAMSKASSRYGLKSPVLSYQDAQTEQDYDLLPYSMGMGRRAGHTFVLVGKDGEILWRKDYWPSVGMSVPGGRMFVPGSEILSEVQKVLGGSS